MSMVAAITARTTETVPGPVGVSGCADCRWHKSRQEERLEGLVVRHRCLHPKKERHWRCPMVGNCFYHEPATEETKADED